MLFAVCVVSACLIGYAIISLVPASASLKLNPITASISAGKTYSIGKLLPDQHYIIPLHLINNTSSSIAIGNTMFSCGCGKVVPGESPTIAPGGAWNPELHFNTVDAFGDYNRSIRMAGTVDLAPIRITYTVDRPVMASGKP